MSSSWKITKKLKETHLAPSFNPFSRSSSSAALAPAETHQAETNAPSASSEARRSVEATEPYAPPPPPSLKPGILVVTLHEGKGFSLSKEGQKTLSGPGPQYYDNGVAGSVRPTPTPRSSNSVAGSYSNFSRQQQQQPAGGINAAPTVHGRYHSKNLPYALIEFDNQQVFVNAVSGSPENPLWAGNHTSYKFDVSRVTELGISFYIRNPNAPPNTGRSHDIFIGVCSVHPRYEEVRKYNEDPKASKRDKERAAAAHAQHERTLGQTGIDWTAVQYGTGQVKVGVEFVENRQQSLKIEDFELLKVVGKGSFGKVMQVMKRDTHRIYALKTIRKAHIISRSEVAHTLAERSVLAQINNPFIVPLKFSFQSPEKLYLVLAFVNGGELFHHLQKEQRFDINRARFYTAELLCALECLHGFNVIYRDLKPENILLDYSGHIALCDFGLCKLDMREGTRTNTFCGTPEYLAPEVLEGNGYDKTVDWWTLGVLLYEMLTGLPPFYDENTNTMYTKIMRDPLHFPSDERIVSEPARDLLEKLLDRNPETRLGNETPGTKHRTKGEGIADIKAHRFFAGINWLKLLERKYEPTFKPNVADQLDTANFDREFTSEAPADSYVEGPMLSQTMQQQFAGWSYNRPVAGLGDAGGSVKDPSFGSVAR